MRGQPRPHALGFVFGCRHCREMFLERANGDLVLPHWSICRVPGSERERFKNGGDGRYCFGLEEWIPTARFHDPFPVQSYNIHVRRGGIALEQKCFAVPLMHSMARKDPKPDALLAAMVRFRFENVDDYFYWLSTDCLTWRGVDHAARALAEIRHPDARRLQREADRFRQVRINGRVTKRFDARKGDVDITGRNGRIVVEARY